MALSLSTLRSFAVTGGGERLWQYETTDTAAAVGGAGYFNEAGAYLRAGDVVLVKASNAFRMFDVSAVSAAGAVTVRAEVGGVAVAPAAATGILFLSQSIGHQGGGTTRPRQSAWTNAPFPDRLFGLAAPFFSHINGDVWTPEFETNQNFDPGAAGPDSIRGAAEGPLVTAYRAGVTNTMALAPLRDSGAGILRPGASTARVDPETQLMATAPLLADLLPGEQIWAATAGEGATALPGFAPTGWLRGDGLPFVQPATAGYGPNGDNALAIVRSWAAAALAQGRAFRVGAVVTGLSEGVNFPGARDGVWGVDFKALMDRFRTEIQAITGQAEPPDVLMMQSISGTGVNRVTALNVVNNVNGPQKNFGRTAPGYHLIVAPYFGAIETVDSDIHADRSNRLVFGWTMAHAIKRIAFDRPATNRWQDPGLISVVAVGPNLIRATWGQPPEYGPLQIDTARLGPTVENHGLALANAGGVIAGGISAVPTLTAGVPNSLDIPIASPVAATGTFLEVAVDNEVDTSGVGGQPRFVKGRSSLRFTHPTLTANPAQSILGAGPAGAPAVPGLHQYVIRERFPVPITAAGGGGGTTYTPSATEAALHALSALVWGIGASDDAKITATGSPLLVEGVANLKAGASASAIFSSAAGSRPQRRLTAADGGLAADVAAREAGIRFISSSPTVATWLSPVAGGAADVTLAGTEWAIAAIVPPEVYSTINWLFGQGSQTGDLNAGVRFFTSGGTNPTVQLKYGASVVNAPGQTVAAPLCVIAERTAAGLIRLRVNGVSATAVDASAVSLAGIAQSAPNFGTINNAPAAGLRGVVARAYRFNKPVISDLSGGELRAFELMALAHHPSLFAFTPST